MFLDTTHRGLGLMENQSPMLRRNFKEVLLMEQELAYSFHLGSDKNKSKLAKKYQKEMYLEQHLYQIMQFKMQMIYQEQISII